MERELKELKGAQLQGKMAMGDKDEFIERIEKDKERLNGVIREKDVVIAQKERLIQEYKSDIEKERREKADISKKNKELQSSIDENRYLLQ